MNNNKRCGTPTSAAAAKVAAAATAAPTAAATATTAAPAGPATRAAVATASVAATTAAVVAHRLLAAELCSGHGLLWKTRTTPAKSSRLHMAWAHGAASPPPRTRPLIVLLRSSPLSPLCRHAAGRGSCVLGTRGGRLAQMRGPRP